MYGARRFFPSNRSGRDDFTDVHRPDEREEGTKDTNRPQESTDEEYEIDFHEIIWEKFFPKAIAMGADAVAIATAAMIAIGCQQYRVCNSGKCPVGIGTQDPELRKRFHIEESSKRLENYLNVVNDELKTFARITGNNNIHNLSNYDIVTTNNDIAKNTNIKHV